MKWHKYLQEIDKDETLKNNILKIINIFDSQNYDSENKKSDLK